ncbi:MAG: GDP-mannose 4,6-dehydratase [Candidatus Omnitrophota bacterium]
MPMFCKKVGEEEFDIKPIAEIVPFDKSVNQYQSREVSGICVWGKGGWVKVRYASAYPHDIAGNNKKPRFINSRSGAFMATSSHVGFMEGGDEKEVGDMTVGDCLEVIDFPECGPTFYGTRRITEEEAELLGMMVGDGSLTHEKWGIGIHGKFTNSSLQIRDHFDYLWSAVTGGHTKYYPTRSGFNPAKIVGQLRLNGGNEWLRGIDIYNEDRTKRVPKAILNSEMSVMLAFLRGYNVTDGLKSNPCTYELKNFKTNSATLAMGLWYLIEKTTKQDINLTVETKEDGRIFYSLNLLSTVDSISKEHTVKELVLEGASQREMSRLTGISRTFIRKIQYGGSACLEHHLHKNPFEIKKIVEMQNYQGWFCDLETSSGEFHCGIGKIHVHNSPRRGETFVTRKITRAVAAILAGKQKYLYLGNLKAKRDWGYAQEYVEAMWKIMNQEQADDYVIGTGQPHSVEDFVRAAFEYAGLKWKPYVKIDQRYFRPTEVENLYADNAKTEKKIGWQPKVNFLDLVKIMVDADMRVQGLKPIGEGDKILEEKFPQKWWMGD